MPTRIQRGVHSAEPMIDVDVKYFSQVSAPPFSVNATELGGHSPLTSIRHVPLVDCRPLVADNVLLGTSRETS